MTARPGPALHERAPAKVNLTLHVLGRRADGYHALESLVVFAGAADELVLHPGEPLALAVKGEGGDLGPADDNLVLRAARAALEGIEGLAAGRFELEKRLPVAAGLGGGSADAAAALRLLARANGLPPDDPRLVEAGRRVGADVAVCLHCRPAMMRGAGESVSPLARLPDLGLLLVNPRRPLATSAVFARLGLAPGQPLEGEPHPDPAALTSQALFAALAAARNDLQAPAIALEPAIAAVLAALEGLPGCRLARMSGSGASCFGLFDTPAAAREAGQALRPARPGWWVAA